MDFSWVRDEQAEHIRALTGRVRLATVPPDHDSAPTATTSSDIQERVVLIRIPRLHHPGMTSLELYEATRKWWVMSPLRHNPDFAFTVVDGFVQAVFRIDEWEQDPGSRRWAFHGARDLKREKLYAGLDVTNYLPAGAQNPIRYVNCCSRELEALDLFVEDGHQSGPLRIGEVDGQAVHVLRSYRAARSSPRHGWY